MTEIDDAGIKRLVRNRVPEIVEGDECIQLNDFVDGKGIAILTEISGKPHAFAEKMPNKPTRDDVMNLIDKISERVRLTRKFSI